MLEELKKHWLVSHTLVAVAAAGITWGALEKVVVGPREFAIGQLQRDILELRSEIDKLTAETRELKAAAAAKPTAPSAPSAPSPSTTTATSARKAITQEDYYVVRNTSVTTRDGRLVVQVVNLKGNYITLAVFLDAQEPVEYYRNSGDRVSIDGGDRFYFIDLRRVRTDGVDLVIIVSPK